MTKFKNFNFIKIINRVSLTGIIYLIIINIQSFFNQTTYRHLHIDERLVVLNPIINVYQVNDFYSRFQDLAPSLLKNILILVIVIFVFDLANNSLKIIEQDELELSVYYKPLNELSSFISANVLK